MMDSGGVGSGFINYYLMLRDMFSERKPVIEPAIDVHHTYNVNTAEGWIRRYDISGLRSLCKSCHSLETIKEQNERKLDRIDDFMNWLGDF
jgi:hypothetical protein